MLTTHLSCSLLGQWGLLHILSIDQGAAEDIMLALNLAAAVKRVQMMLCSPQRVQRAVGTPNKPKIAPEAPTVTRSLNRKEAMLPPRPERI